MSFTPKNISALVILAAAVLVGGPAHAQYTYTNISDPMGTVGTVAFGINNQGQIIMDPRI